MFFLKMKTDKETLFGRFDIICVQRNEHIIIIVHFFPNLDEGLGWLEKG